MVYYRTVVEWNLLNGSILFLRLSHGLTRTCSPVLLAFILFSAGLFLLSEKENCCNNIANHVEILK